MPTSNRFSLNCASYVGNSPFLCGISPNFVRAYDIYLFIHFCTGAKCPSRGLWFHKEERGPWERVFSRGYSYHVIVKIFTSSQQFYSTKLTVTVNFALIANTILPISFCFVTTIP